MTKQNSNTKQPYDAATELGLHYMGDCNIEHGGYFYNADDWKYGYAMAVDVCIADGKLFVQTGTINKLSDSDMFEVYSTVDFDGMPEEQCRHYEIDYCKSQFGVESDYDDTNAGFDMSDCGDYFKSANGWISIDNLQGWIIHHFCHRIKS